jgi:hypothetical protein
MLPLLVDELADHAPFSTGTTLVLGASEAEAPLARELAYWLSTMRGSDRKMLAGGTAPPTPTPSGTPSGHASSSALVAVGDQPHAHATGTERVAAHTWEGESEGQAMRRAARLASRVLVVLRSGTMSMFEVAQIRSRLGRDQGIGVLLVDLDPQFMHFRDRIGGVGAFWREEHTEADA